MRFFLFLFCLLLAAPLSLAVAAAAAGRGSVREPLVGGWQPIENVSKPHVQKIARFAVDEHNKNNAQNPLRLIKVETGDIKIVSGVIYRLVIVAAGAGASTDTAGEYEATVWEKSWEDFMELTSFIKLLKY